MPCTPEPTDAPALVEKAAAIGVTLDVDAAEEVLAYLDAMLATNQHINLTAGRDREAAVVLHALDSVAFQLAAIRPQHVLDLGTGNG
ncbi:MAG: RsmG family class I SAM-dependent methyltransferase, partial [Planctomycetota bacterium]|nr:RsmG family class I SAM-dependent methyltransferase [Planctomycetota bacterium]